MGTVSPTPASAAAWDLAVPSLDQAMPGVRMAGFSGCAPHVLDLRIVPYPAVTMFVDFGDGALVDGAGARHMGGGVVGLAPDGMRTVGRDVDCLQIRLSPLVARAVLGDLPESGTTVLSLDEIWGPDAAQLRELLHAAPSWHARFATTQNALARRRDAGPDIDPEVAYAWKQMMLQRGQVRVEQLAEQVGWSRKRFWSRFRTQIGLTPKRASQLVRFDTAAHRLAAGHNAADVAIGCGYSDQSHLHRDARTFVGLTPTAIADAPWLDVDDIVWPARRRPAEG